MEAAVILNHPVCVVSLEDDWLLVFDYAEGAVVDKSVAQEVVALARTAVDSARPTLVRMTTVRKVTRGARAYFGGAENALVTSRAALVVGSDLSRVIANFFLGLSRTAMPVRLFTSEMQARSWLAEP